MGRHVEPAASTGERGAHAEPPGGLPTGPTRFPVGMWVWMLPETRKRNLAAIT